jgi:multidrug efflux pump
LEDRGQFYVLATGPEGTTFEYMDEYVDSLIVLAREEIPEATSIITVTSPGFGASSSVNSAFMRVILNDAEDREKSQSEIVRMFRPKVSALTKAKTFIAEPQSIGRSRSGLPIQYVIQAANLEKLKEVLPEFLLKASQDPTFTFVNVDLKFNKPEVRIEIDREKARKIGVSVRDVAQTLQLGFSGQRFGYFIMNGQQYQIIGQVDRQNRNEPFDLQSLYVENDRGELIQLDNLVNMQEQSTPPQLYRYNRYTSATISASLADGKAISDGIEAMDRIKAEVLDDTYLTSLSGTSADYQESSSSLYFAFIFALILVYLVLAAQFESFRDPFTIMLTVPLAIAGALFSLALFDQTLNIFSEIGMIMLVGLVTKNGILIVEFANQRKAKGLTVMESIIGAAEARFRPILMTSLSTILGILPIALALSAGAESRVSMGIAVIGGLIFATILTLYIIPAVYSKFSSNQKRLARF